MTNYLETVM